MSMALSNKKSENNISFNSKSLISLTGQTVVAGGQCSVPEISVGFKCDYLKLLVNISTSDLELTTSEFKSVTAVYNIEYIEDEELSINNIRTVCFTPKFQHEVNNKDTYTIIELPAKKITKINMTVYNNEATDITIEDARILYSRLMDEDAVKEMAGTGGGDVPVSNVLTLYNLDNNYTIDGYNKSLILDLVVPDEILEQYGEKTEASNGDKYGTLETTIDCNNTGGATVKYSGEDTVKWIGDRKWTIKNSKITITSTTVSNGYKSTDGLVEFIVRINNNKQLYGKRVVEVKNSAVKDIYIKSISSTDGNLHVNENVNIEIGFKPENSCCMLPGKFNLDTEDGIGLANNANGSNSYSVVNGHLGNKFTLRGVREGRVRLYLGNDEVGKTFYFNVIDDTTEAFEIISDSTTNSIDTGDGVLNFKLVNDLDAFKPVEYSLVNIGSGRAWFNANGNTNISSTDGKATVYAKEDGQIKLVAKSYNSKETSTIINITGQYPEDVAINSGDGTYKVNVGSQLVLNVQPTNNCRSTYDKYSVTVSKIDAGVDYNIDTFDNGKTYKILGKAVGKFNLSIQRTKDAKILRSQVIEVVANERPVNIPLPDKNSYWALVKRVDEDVPILCYIDNSSLTDRFIFKSAGSIHANNTFLRSYQYRLKNFAWEKRGDWAYESTAQLSSNVSMIYESNLDIYDVNGKLLVAKTPSWEDVNLANLINKLKL